MFRGDSPHMLTPIALIKSLSVSFRRQLSKSPFVAGPILVATTAQIDQLSDLLTDVTLGPRVPMVYTSPSTNRVFQSISFRPSLLFSGVALLVFASVPDSLPLHFNPRRVQCFFTGFRGSLDQEDSD
ncbi:hypothetical protein T265_03425 [Opisthorchis viverrini]|uniref:Uncharacterized protein n=1 Tax=Opisthorchis viverrini TaxID=6198 RepID=A0A074ZSD9_OPIVI|nr:hypothetical protein T265_03425 [Opisthorchis viverrini]KER30051.1 hypothetical protein T265_03425 [Opisthorchis viverrini]